MTQNAGGNTNTLPLCVDMDGSLIRTDSLWEACLKLLRKSPLSMLQMPIWLLRGKASFKQKVCRQVQLDAAILPYSEDFLTFLRQEKARGRHLCLVTAADEHIVAPISEFLALFDAVLCSDGQTNLAGSNKASTLVEQYGEKGFVYAGNAEVDLKVWKHAAAAITVNASARLQHQAANLLPIEADFSGSEISRLQAMQKALRPHQWAKNFLLFVPVLLAHSLQATAWLNVLLAFVAFSLTASSIYIINDLLDLEADRQHPDKRNRPFASAALSIPAGLAMLPILLGIALLVAWQVNSAFFILLLGYVVLTTAYSLTLKMRALVDVLTLTLLYTVRIVGGGFAANVELSYWLLAFSIFFFFSLALAKRYSELHNLAQKGDLSAGTRGYVVSDLPVVILFGVSAGYIAILVMILYIHDLQIGHLYNHPMWLWGVGISLLYWVSRVWLLAHRGSLHEDPVLFALHDRISYVVALCTGLTIWLAL